MAKFIGTYTVEAEQNNTGKAIRVMTPDGAMWANPGDWIVTEAGGITSVCGKVDFEMNYKPLSE